MKARWPDAFDIVKELGCPRLRARPSAVQATFYLAELCAVPIRRRFSGACNRVGLEKGGQECPGRRQQ